MVIACRTEATTAESHCFTSRSAAFQAAQSSFRLKVAPQKGRPATTASVVLTTHEIASMWTALKQQRLVHTVFHDGEITCKSDFIQLATSPACWFYGVFAAQTPLTERGQSLTGESSTCTSPEILPFAMTEGASRQRKGTRSEEADNIISSVGQVGNTAKPLAFFWLNAFSGRTAMIHFAVLNTGLRHAVPIGHHVCSFLLQCQEVVPHTGRQHPAAPKAPLDALLGLTPTNNRRALQFIKRLGFRPLAILPSALAQPQGFQDGTLSMLTADRLSAEQI
ncbi:hypothetical protein [Oleidesulfovibrio sp.]|uniref:hypothetical protein n=1 Tax=Oleidesulfovibrio sp. TaxID=2909707 RepID=UPI003A87E76D